MESKISPEASDRKERSEAILRAEGIPINRSLPVVETEEQAARRVKHEVAYRAVALLLVAATSKGLERATREQIIEQYALDTHLTGKELAFLNSNPPAEQDRINFSWRFEAAWTLLWALGYVESLGKPDALCDVMVAWRFMWERSPAQFIADANLRPLNEILDQVDLIYRYDWAVVDARLNGKQPPNGLDPAVTYERHYALNWLVGYMDQAWDEVSTDT